MIDTNTVAYLHVFFLEQYWLLGFRISLCFIDQGIVKKMFPFGLLINKDSVEFVIFFHRKEHSERSVFFA